MKTIKSLTTGLIILITLALTFSNCENSLITSATETDTTGSTITTDDTSSVTPLSDNEKADLLFVREEEKLARDVYLYAYDKYGLTIFNNISKSEQRHMDAILSLLNTYNLEDPASTERGVFTDSLLQSLYYQLTAQVDSSILSALTVGATIEDLDIADLEESIDSATHADIINTYSRLECGSRNHLRAFYGQILNYGGDYTPQFISQEEFDEIINSDHETCGTIN